MRRATFDRMISVLQDRDHRPDSARTIKALVTCEASQVHAAVKSLPPKRIASEAVAAHVASVLTVPCARIYLVQLSDAEAAKHQLVGGVRLDSSSLGLFSSEFSSLPQSKALAYGAPMPNWYSQTFVFDVLVGNVDRAYKNVLADERSWLLIDHDQILLSRDWNAELLRATPLELRPNVIRNDITLVCRAGMSSTEVQTILAIANQWKGQLTSESLEPLTELPSLGVISGEDLKAIRDFLIQRSLNLDALVTRALEAELSN